jgi:hypothetical protein
MENVFGENFLKILQVFKQSRAVSGFGVKPLPLERSRFFRIPLTRLFFGDKMGSYVGDMIYNKGMSSAEIGYYFEYARQFDRILSDAEKKGFNFRVHMPFVQGAFIVDITGSDLNSQAEELKIKLNGDNTSQNGNLPVQANGRASDGLVGKGNGTNGKGKNGKGKKHPHGVQIFPRRGSGQPEDVLPREVLLGHNPGN